MTSHTEPYEELRSKSVPGLFLERAKRTPEDVAYRAKKLGIYKERTWKTFKQKVANSAMGLMALGLKRGDRLALMGDPCEEYAICELAAQSLGAVTYGLYPTSSPKEVNYLMKDGEACIFVAENQEYVDRILPLYDELPKLRHVIVIDTTGTFMYDHSALVSYDDLTAKGREVLDADAGAFEEEVRKVNPTDDLFIVYTSGTTGSPKGVLISHGKHLAAAYTLIDRYPILAEIPHRTVVYLPLCHVLGKDVAVTLPLLTSIIPHYGEDIENLAETIFETAPTVLFTVPRYLQKYVSNIIVGIENSSPLKRSIYRAAIKIGRRHVKGLWDGKRNPGTSLLYFICYQLAFRPILNKIGFNRIKIALSAGAPLPPEVMALWQIYGLNLSEFYGQTETGGAIIAAQGGRFPRPGHVGVPPAGWEVKLSEEGEILAKGKDGFECYLNNPEGTSEVLDNNGWLHTGDVGEWTSDGNLKIVDRARDIIVTSGGKTISPTYVENCLRSVPYISEAVVFGHQRKYLTALIEIDFETVSGWARANDIVYTGFTSLTKHPEIISLIGSASKKASEDLARVEQIKGFRIIPKELDPEDEDEPITPTRKIKRELVYEKFKDLVESMYSDKEEQLVASEIGDVLG
ncbi:MAG: AMP-binding protein [Deltaproteobacteria bacterium]|jgi:long-chain acyl-CoA synthetase|nr:AMP-binding protein [Deltaproteobacteria bacterium]